MKKRTSENTKRSTVNSYRPSDNINGENWFANHQKLLWGIGGAVVLGAGAMLLLKSKNNSDKSSDTYDDTYSDTYDELNAINQAVLNDNLGEEEIVITTITELE